MSSAIPAAAGPHLTHLPFQLNRTPSCYIEQTARQIVHRAPEKEARRKPPAPLALKFRDEIGRSNVQCDPCGEGKAIPAEQRDVLGEECADYARQREGSPRSQCTAAALTRGNE